MKEHISTKSTAKPANPQTITVGIVEDHTFMREGLKVFVESLEGFKCLWEAASASEAVSMMAAEPPAVLIVDITLPDRSGMELIKDIHVTNPKVAILVLSMHQEELYAERALKAGARGFLMKNAPHEALEEALRRVAAGGVAVSQKMSDQVLMAFSTGAAPRSETGLHSLTDREFEVFQLLGEGKGTQQVADSLRISHKTVDVHRMNIKNKLKLEDGLAVTRYAIRWSESRKHGSPPDSDRGMP